MWKDGKPGDIDIPQWLTITSALEYRKSMSELIARLSSKRQFFVRCIKPNDELIEDVTENFNCAKVRHQIQYLGLVENARVRKAGFVNRVQYQSFLQRYRMLYNGDTFDLKQLGLDVSEMADQRPFFGDICNEIITDNWPSSLDNQVAFGKTMIFFRELTILKCLEQKRLEYLEMIVVEIQTVSFCHPFSMMIILLILFLQYSRTLLAKRQFTRMTMAPLILKQLARNKKEKLMEELFVELQKYETDFQSICQNTPYSFLEYHQLDMFQWPDSLLQLQKDQLFSKDLPKMVAQLNKWMIIFKFPMEYWNDKLLRVEACKIFWEKKADWGETRRRWLGNYLIGSVDCSQFGTFKRFFHKRPDIFSEVLFGSYMLKTNAHNMEQVRAVVMTKQHLYKLDIDEMSFQHWVSISDIDAVSVTPDSDQLVVLHTKSRHSDLVFSFYSLKGESLGISTAQMAFNHSKVGEFVTLLYRQYQKYSIILF